MRTADFFTKLHNLNICFLVLQIVKMQMAAMDLMTQTSEKYKRQIQIDGELQNSHAEANVVKHITLLSFIYHILSVCWFLFLQLMSDTHVIYVFDSNKHQTSGQKWSP